MAISPNIRDYLDAEGIDYEIIEHPAAYTTQEEAAASHITGFEWAKTVIFFTDDAEPIMAALPAPYNVDVDRLQELVGTGELRLAEEAEFADLYPGCEPGAMPPLGPLYEQRVFVDTRLSEDETIVFDAGTHTDAIRMRYADFERLVQPTVGAFGELRT